MSAGHGPLAPLPDRVVRDPALLAFADEVGGVDAGPVAIEGGRTQWHLGGHCEPGTRLVRAPAGVVAFEPAEMTIQVRAGTTLDELDAALEPAGQRVALQGLPGTATVGGVLSVGLSGPTRLGHGHLRETLLQARYVSAEGLLVTAGGPTVKNVTGFDLCRVLVGSFGTLGLLGEVILRTRPRPQAAAWLSGPADPTALFDRLYRPVSLLWDGATVWLYLEGYPEDVEAQTAIALEAGLVPVDGPPPLPSGRHSAEPAALRSYRPDAPRSGRFVAEFGVGVVHGEWSGPTQAAPDASVVALNGRLKNLFDPTGRLNPGRDPLTPSNGKADHR